MSEHWSGFTQFTVSNENTSRRRHVVRGAADKNSINIKARLFVAIGLGMSNAAQREEEHHWADDKPKLDNAGKLWCIYFIDPDEMEFKDTMKKRA